MGRQKMKKFIPLVILVCNVAVIHGAQGQYDMRKDISLYKQLELHAAFQSIKTEKIMQVHDVAVRSSIIDQQFAGVLNGRAILQYLPSIDCETNKIKQRLKNYETDFDNAIVGSIAIKWACAQLQLEHFYPGEIEQMHTYNFGVMKKQYEQMKYENRTHTEEFYRLRMLYHHIKYGLKVTKYMRTDAQAQPRQTPQDKSGWPLQ